MSHFFVLFLKRVDSKAVVDDDDDLDTPDGNQDASNVDKGPEGAIDTDDADDVDKGLEGAMDTEDDARSEDTADVTQLSPMMIAPDMYTPEVAVEVEVAAVDIRQERDYNEAIIYECNAVDRPDTHQQMIKLVDAMNPQPFSVFCADDIEHNGLAHQIVIPKATGSTCTIHKMLPQ